jgi:hypothetical protein
MAQLGETSSSARPWKTFHGMLKRASIRFQEYHSNRMHYRRPVEEAPKTTTFVNFVK